MNLFLLFGYDTYYPGGGWCDFRGAFETIEQAKSRAEEQPYSNSFEVVDINKLKVVSEGNCYGAYKNKTIDWKDLAHPT